MFSDASSDRYDYPSKTTHTDDLTKKYSGEDDEIKMISDTLEDKNDVKDSTPTSSKHTTSDSLLSSEKGSSLPVLHTATRYNEKDLQGPPDEDDLIDAKYASENKKKELSNKELSNKELSNVAYMTVDTSKKKKNKHNVEILNIDDEDQTEKITSEEKNKDKHHFSNVDYMTVDEPSTKNNNLERAAKVDYLKTDEPTMKTRKESYTKVDEQSTNENKESDSKVDFVKVDEPIAKESKESDSNVFYVKVDEPAQRKPLFNKKAQDTVEESKKAQDTVEESKKAQDTVEESKKAQDTVEESKKAQNTVGESKKAQDTVEESMVCIIIFSMMYYVVCTFSRAFRCANHFFVKPEYSYCN